MLRIRFYEDPESGMPHIYGHAVSEDEVEAVLRHPLEDRQGFDGARVAIGRTAAGRILRVVYVAGERRGDVFVITAIELRGKPLAAFRKRNRR